MHIYIYTRTLSSEVNMYVYIDECTDCIVTFFSVVQDFVLGVIYIYLEIYIPGLCPWSY